MLVSQKAFQIFSQKMTSTGSDLLVLVFGIDFCEVLCYNSIMKTCKKCKNTLPIDQFSVHKQMKDGHLNKCKECAKKDSAEWRVKNPEKIKEGSDRYYKEHKEQVYKTVSEWQSKNREKVNNWAKRWRDNNKAHKNSLTAKRRAARHDATPPWLTPEQVVEMKLVYIKAKELEKLDGIKRHVDHIIPLQGDSVCGLHVPWNLQILTAVENIAKSNK